MENTTENKFRELVNNLIITLSSVHNSFYYDLFTVHFLWFISVVGLIVLNVIIQLRT